MSFTIDIQLRCDGCAQVLSERSGCKSIGQVQSVRFGMQYDFNKEHGMTTKTPHRRTKHLCRKCADTAPTKSP